MPTYRAQWCFQGPSGDPADRYCNTWHFSRVAEIAPADWDVNDALYGGISPGAWHLARFQGFYEYISSGGLSPILNNIGTTFKIYALADVEPRAPRWSYMFPAAPLTGTSDSQPLPSEVAICLSFEAIAAGGTVRARRRGRVYLGPLTVETIDSSAETARVEPDYAATILDGYEAMGTTMLGVGSFIGVYSPTDDLFLASARAWVDNAFDTQRRRGEDSTGRTERELYVA